MRHLLLLSGIGALIGVSAWPHCAPAPGLALLGALGCAALCVLAPRGPALALGALAAGLCLGWARPGLEPEGPRLEGLVSVEGVVQRASGRRALVQVSRVDSHPAEGAILAWFSEPPPRAGARVALFGRASPFWEDALPGALDPARGAALRRLHTELRVQQSQTMGPPPSSAPAPFQGAQHRGLLRALAFGDRSGVTEATRALLRRTGTSHLLAISGLHLGLVAAMVGGLATAATRPLSVLWPYGGLRWAAAVAGGGAALSFGALVGWPVSAQRAAWMILAGLGLWASGRPPRPWNLLGLAAVGVALADPGATRELSFLLSFGAVVGLLCASPRLERLLPPDLPRPLAWLARATGATLGATLGTLPVAAWVFQELSWTSPLANLVAVPIVSGVVLPGALLGAAGLPLATAIADRGLTLTLLWLGRMDAEPLHPAVGPEGAALLALACLLLKRPALAGLLALLALGLRPLPQGELALHLLSVGQGDAALIEWPDGQRVLIDGGPPSARVLRWLRRRGARRLDEVVLTHPHPDHSGGLGPVLESLEVGALRVPRPPTPDEPSYAALIEITEERGVPVIGPSASTLPGLRLLHPDPQTLADPPSVNDLSIVLRLVFGQSSALFTGDIEAPAEARLLASLEPTDVLKVAHHGSASSSTQALLDRVRPRVALISCGVDNRFGHPRPEVLWRLRGSRVLRTDRDGSVELRSDGRRWRFRRWRPGRGWSAWRAAAGSPSPRQPQPR